MTIDEAITNETEMAEGLREQYECMMECSEIFREQKKVFIEQCKYDAEYHEQLAEWLEELKAIKDGSIPIIHGNAELEFHDKKVYNKAIDDFVKFASDMPTVKAEDGTIRPMWLEEIAKELKEQNQNTNIKT